MENTKKLPQQPVKPMNERLKALFETEGSEISIQEVNKRIFELQTLGIGTGLDIFQYYVFIKQCNDLGLSPLKKEIYVYKSGNQLTTIVSHLVYISKASKNPNYQLPELELHEYDKEGKKLPIEDVYYIASVKRKGDDTVLRKKFIMKEWSQNTTMWRKQPIHMLSVRALKNMLAIAYPDEVGTYEQLEFEYDVKGAEHKKNAREAAAVEIKGTSEPRQEEPAPTEAAFDPMG